MPAAAPSEPWRLRLLGGFGLVRGGQRLQRLHSRAARLLLARLALQPQREHAREELAGWLWPEADAATALARLRQTLSTLKATLERPAGSADPVAVIEADRRVLRLAPGALDCDVLRFEQALRDGDTAAAAACWGGELLPGDYDEWVLQQRRRLEALAARIGLDAAGAASPGPAAPVRAATKTPAPPADRALPRPDDTLPHYLTGFVGGDAAVRAATDAQAQTRLLVLRGPGGLGKTRLAVTLARAQLEAGAVDTARFVSWVGCHDRAGAAERLRQALGLTLGAAPPRSAEAQVEAVLDAALLALAGRRALLVLDNAEQLPADALALAPALLERLPALRLVLTSRRAIALAGARDHAVAPLAPEAAAQLFIERARDVRPDFQAHAAQREAIATVARLLGGLPLAIELAAARVRTLPPPRLAALLQSGGAERWRVLGRRGAAALGDPRHASIEAVLDASLALLSPGGRALLALAACIPAPFFGAVATLALQAQGLAAADALAALDELAADGLLVPPGTGRPAAGPADEGDRLWALPEPVRDLVVETLPPAQRGAAIAAWRAALARWLPGLAPHWPLASLDPTLPVLQAVLEPHDAPPADTLALMLALAPVWQERTPPSALRAALEAALQPPGDAVPPGPALRARALAADLAFAAGDRDAARAHALALEAALEALPAASAEVPAAAGAAARLSLARVAWRVDGDADRARRWLRDAAHGADDDPVAEAQRLRFEATLAYEAGRDTAACDAALLQALRLLAGGDGAGGHLERALRYNLAISAIHAGRPHTALPLLQALAAEAREAGNRRLLADVLNATGSALDALGRLDEAEQATRASLAEAWQRLETENALYALWNLGLLALRRGDAERAARLTGFADRFWRRHFGALAEADRRDMLRARRRCRQRLGRVAGQRCWDEGAALPLAAAVALALDGAAAASGRA